MRARTALVALGTASLVGYVWGFRRVVGAGTATLSSYASLVSLLVLLYFAALWIVLRRDTDDRVLLWVCLGFGLLFRLVLLPTPVVLSSDVYRYLWDGRVQRVGISPYRHPPSAPELEALRDPVIHRGINRPDKRTVYPPGAQAVFLLAAHLAPDSLLGWRVLLLVAEVATGWLLLGLLARLAIPRVAILAYAWAPLVVFEGVQAGHLEVIVATVVLAALRLRLAGATAGAGLALGLAVSLKLYPIVLLAAWWRRPDWRMPVATLAVVAAGYALYLAAAGWHILGFLPEYFGSAEDFNLGLRYFLTGWLPLQDGMVRETVRGVTMVGLGAALCLALARIWRYRSGGARDVVRAAMAAAGTYLVLVPTAMHAWYAVWIVPFLALCRSPAWLWFTGAISLSYLAYAWDGLPFWVRALEYVPLYGLLAWEWRRGAPVCGDVRDHSRSARLGTRELEAEARP